MLKSILIQIRSLRLLIFFCLAAVQNGKVWRSNFNWIVLKPASFNIHVHVCISSIKYMYMYVSAQPNTCTCMYHLNQIHVLVFKIKNKIFYFVLNESTGGYY